MKLDNEDAFKLASKYMDHNVEHLSEINYFVKFLEAYSKFDDWLQAEHPVDAAKAAKKHAKFV